jgi:hypothetical protein
VHSAFHGNDIESQWLGANARFWLVAEVNQNAG